MSDDQALPGNPLISAATRSGRSRAVMEITRLEASTRALRGCGCPADNARRLLLRSSSCCPENRVTAALLSPGGCSPPAQTPPSPIWGDEGALAASPPKHSSIPPPPPRAKAVPIRCPNPKTTVTKTYQIEPQEGPPPAFPPPPNGIEQICAHTSPARSQAASDIHARWHGSAARPLPRLASPTAAPLEMQHRSRPSRTPRTPQSPPRPSWRDPSTLVQLVLGVPSTKGGPQGDFSRPG